MKRRPRQPRKTAAAAGGEAAGGGPQEPGTSPLPLSQVVGNSRPRALLARALQEERLSPALLLHGPPGIGKFTTAWALAAALNCGQPQGADACCACKACVKIARHAHPDVKILESEAAARHSGRPVFFPPATPGSASRPSSRLLIGQVRRLLRETDFRPFEGGRRVLIIRDLESDPSQGCANALLKSLEEPPSGTQFILVSSRPERLPDTVRSRCQSLAFLPATLDETAAFLTGRGVETGEARLRAALSGGRPGAALGLDAGHGLRQRDAVLAALARAATGDAVAAMAAADDLLAAREDLDQLLSTLALVARDLMVQPWDGAVLVNVDRLAEIDALAASLPAATAAALLDRIAWCQAAAERNVSPPLMLATLMLAAGGHLPADLLTLPWLPGEEGQPGC